MMTGLPQAAQFGRRYLEKLKKKLPAPATQVNIKRNELLLWLLLRSPLRDVATPNMNGTPAKSYFQTVFFVLSVSLIGVFVHRLVLVTK